MAGLASGCKEIATRLAGDLRQLAVKLHEITAGVADGSRKVGEVLADRDRRGRSAFPDDTGSPAGRGSSMPHTGVPRPGDDGPLMLAGRRSLDELIARYGDNILFHGSAEPIHRLEPRQMTWTIGTGRYPDGEPAICVDTSYDIPMFLSLFKGRARCVYRATEDGGCSYGVEGAGAGVTSGGYTGHVHVLDRQYFQEVHPDYPDGWPGPTEEPRPAELRSTTAVEPFAIVKVTPEDFPHPIDDFEAVRYA